MISAKWLLKSMLFSLGLMSVAYQAMVFHLDSSAIKHTRAMSQQRVIRAGPKALSQSEYFYNREMLLKRFKNQ